MINALPTSHACQDDTFFMLALGRNKDCDGLTDRLIGGVAEESLSTGIPGANLSGQSLADDGIIRTLHNFGQHPLRDVGPLLFGDIDENVARTDHAALLIAVGAGMGQEMAAASV